MTLLSRPIRRPTAVARSLRRDYWVGSLLILLGIGSSNLLGLDTLLTNYYYDTATHSFLLAAQYHWLFVDLLHDDIKKVELLLFSPVLIRFAYLLAKRRLADLKSSGYLLLAILLSLGVCSLIRSQSPVACPWDLTLYGGDQPLVEPWAFFQGYNGHCWPSGHASGGFCLLAFFFWLRARQSRLAWLALGVALFMGGIMSWTQIVRGAHFISHCNWSLLFCWLVAGALACCWWREPASGL